LSLKFLGTAVIIYGKRLIAGELRGMQLLHLSLQLLAKVLCLLRNAQAVLQELLSLMSLAQAAACIVNQAESSCLGPAKLLSSLRLQLMSILFKHLHQQLTLQLLGCGWICLQRHLQKKKTQQ